MNEYNEVLLSVKENHYTTESWSDYMVVVNENKLTIENTKEEIAAGVNEIREAQKSLKQVEITLVD